MVSDQKTYAMFSGVENERIAARLENEGAKVFRFAPVEIQKINCEIVDLDQFDWIIFPDVFAVDRFLEVLEAKRIDAFELDAIRTFACGEAVADRLRFVQIHADVIPNSIDDQTLLSTLLSYEENLSGKNFLIPKAADLKPGFSIELSKLGAKVIEIAVYETRTGDKTANLKALLKGGAIDEFIFCSAEDVLYLKHYLGSEDLSEFFSDTKASATSETALQALRENNLRPRFFPIK